MAKFITSLFLSALITLSGLSGTETRTPTDIYRGLQERLDPYTGYVRSFSGIRYKNMGLEKKIASEDSDMAFIDGYSYATFIIESYPNQAKYSFIVARDPRPTGDTILHEQKHRMKTAANKQGKAIELIDLGIATTPLWESAIRTFKADGGVMITASHNPLNENGWKYGDSYKNRGSLLDPAQMSKVLSLTNTTIQNVLDETLDLAGLKKTINEIEVDFESDSTYFDRAIEGYVSELSPLVRDTDRNILLVNDPNGGAAATVNTIVLKKLGFTNILHLNTTLGVPSHKIEPIKGKVGEENDPMKNGLIDVTKALKDTGAKVGIVYDFDADRGNLVLLDKSGTVD